MKNKFFIFLLTFCMVFTSTGIIFALDEVEETKEIKEPVIEKIEEKKIEEVKVDEPQNDKVIEEPKVEEPKVEEPQEEIKAEEVKKEEVKKEEVKTEEAKEKEEPPKKDPEPEEPVVEIITPVEKVIVKLYARNGSGNYAIAQTWNAVANGTNTWANADKNAKQYSPITQGDTTYTYTGVWVDDLGNSYTIGERKKGADFIALFSNQEGPTATLNVYAQYDEWTIPHLTANYIDNVGNAGGSASWKDDGGTDYEHIFKEAVDVPNQYTFLYWKNFDNGNIKNPGDVLTIEKGSLTEDTTINYYAVYEYQPSIRLIYNYKDGTKDTGSRLDAIDIYGEEPEDLYWFYEDGTLVEEGTIINLPSKEITTDLMNIEEVTKVFAHYYTVTWVSNGEVIEEDLEVPYGAEPSYDGATPTKEETDQYIYSFKGWTPEPTTVTEDATYVAEFDATEKEQPVGPTPGPDPGPGPDPEPQPEPEPTPEPEPAPQPEPTPQPEPITPTPTPTPVRPTAPSTPTRLAVAPTPVEEVVDNTPTKAEVPKATTITDLDVPQVAAQGAWALVNLIATILGCIIALLVLFIKKKSDNEEYTEDEKSDIRKMRITKIASILVGIISIIVFILTEDMSLPMILTDKWTLCMILLLIIEVVNIWIVKKQSQREEEDD